MSTTAPWLALATDWGDSEMLDDATDGERLAWIFLLCHAKAHGRAGRVRVRKSAFQRAYRVSERALVGMLARAQKCGAIEVDGENVSICNWRLYQDPAQRQKAGGFIKNEKGASRQVIGDVCLVNGSGQEEGEAGEEPDKPRKPSRSVCTESQARAIYEAYPRKAKPEAAVKAIRAAAQRLTDAGHEDPLGYLTDRVQAFASSPAGRSPPPGSRDFRPHPTTFFNQGQFANDPTEWTRPNGDDEAHASRQSTRSTPADRARERRADERRRDYGEDGAKLRIVNVAS